MESAAVGALRRLGQTELCYWKGKGEVDVIARDRSRTSLVVQVCGTTVQTTPEREFAALEEASRKFPKARTVLVVDRGWESDEDASPPPAEVKPIWEFLLATKHD